MSSTFDVMAKFLAGNNVQLKDSTPVSRVDGSRNHNMIEMAYRVAKGRKQVLRKRDNQLRKQDALADVYRVNSRQITAKD